MALAERVLRALACGCSAAASAVVVARSPVPVPELLGLLARNGGAGYAVVLGWLLLAPVVLVATGLLIRRSRWWYVGATAAYLLAGFGLVVRLRHWVPTSGWLFAVLVISLGTGSAALAAARTTPSP